MTTRAKNANLSPKGTNAPAKTAPKAPSKPVKAPAKAAAPSATKARQTSTARKPSATAAQAGQTLGAQIQEAINQRGSAAVLGNQPGEARNQRDAIPPRAPRSAGLRIPNEADAPTQEELRAALPGVPATGPYSLDAAQMAAAQVAAAHTATLTVVKRMSAEERRYAKRRMEDVISRKKVAFKQERDASDKYQERRRIFAEEIAAGRFTINQMVLGKASYDTDLRDVVMLKNYPAGLEAYTRSQHDAIVARQATMEREGARLIDEIMLGSPADAIARIQFFESTKF